jgi:hypothetical protein
MKFAIALMGLLASQAAFAETLEVPGSTAARVLIAPHVDGIHAASGVDLVVVPRGTGQAMLDLIDGKSSVAVVTVPLTEAVAAARETAWGEGRMLRVGYSLEWHPVAWVDEGTRPLAFVTNTRPTASVGRVLDYLRSEPARASLER